MSIFQSLIWTCDRCNYAEIVYREVNPDQKLTLTTPGNISWMLIQPTVDEPEKLLCEICAKELLEEVNGEIIENDLKGQTWVI